MKLVLPLRRVKLSDGILKEDPGEPYANANYRPNLARLAVNSSAARL